MPWKVSPVPDLRLALCHAVRSAGRPVAAAARDFGVSRKTAHKWIERFDHAPADAAAALADRSRRLQSGPMIEPSDAIGSLAAAAGVPTSTVRFYERRTLLRPRARTGGNYRVYDATSLKRLRFIRAASVTGLSLDDVARLLDGEPGRTCTEVQAALARRLGQTRQRLAALRLVERAIRAALATCSTGEDAGVCSQVTRSTEPRQTA